MPQSGEEHPNINSIMSSCRYPITLQFTDISYKVKLNPEVHASGIKRMLYSSTGDDDPPPPSERTILNGITGMVSPGEMMAILGPSGSGKSTLLNILAGRLHCKQYSGAVLANGHRFTKSLLKKTGYVTQDDVLYPHLTVQETLIFCALLRLPASLTKAEKVTAAEAVVTELGLEKCKDTRVGNAFIRGVSGGERKRVSIGHEMLVNPSLLLLDEPTSGLDSTAAARLVGTLGRLAGRGRTVVAAVHQPSSRVFGIFDKVLVLSEGSCLYFGKGSEAMDYFGSAGFLPRGHVNPADFMLDLANGFAPIDYQYQSDAEKLTVKQNLIASYSRTLAPRVKASVNASTAAGAGTQTGNEKSSKRKQIDHSSIGWFSQFSILVQRGLKERRHECFQTLRVSQVIAAAFLAGAMWWHSNIQHVQDRLGLLFFISIFWGVFASFNAVFAFPQDRCIFIKERASGMYTLSSYFMARMAGDLPMELVLPTVFTTILYWMAGLRADFGAYVLTLVVLLAYVMVAQGLGLFLGAAIMDAKQASTVVTVTMLAFLLTGGFYVQHIPAGLQWVKYTSFTYYSYRLLIKVQYHGSYIGSHYANGTSALESELEEQVSTTVSIAALIFMFVGYRILAYAALSRIR